MFLRIAGHAEVELRSRMLDGRAIGKETFVESYYLLDQICGMCMSSRGGGEPAVFLGLVATQQHQVADAQELQVQQFIFYLLNGGTTADDVRLHGNVVSLLDSRSNGDGSWTTTDALSLKLPIVQLLIYIFRVVSGYIDEGGIEFRQLVNGAKQGIGAVTLQWWKHLK